MAIDNRTTPLGVRARMRMAAVRPRRASAPTTRWPSRCRRRAAPQGEGDEHDRADEQDTSLEFATRQTGDDRNTEAQHGRGNRHPQGWTTPARRVHEAVYSSR